MEIQVLDIALCVCKIRTLAQVDYADKFCFVGKTDEELSLVCSTACVPQDTILREDGWQGFRLTGMLDFALVGVLSRISACLAEQGISIFALSTYHTDYVLVKRDKMAQALAALQADGFTVAPQP